MDIYWNRCTRDPANILTEIYFKPFTMTEWRFSFVVHVYAVAMFLEKIALANVLRNLYDRLIIISD